MKTDGALLAAMRKKWYVWQINAHKPRIKPETKARMRTEFEDSVLEYAAAIEHGRHQAELMEEYNGGLSAHV